MKTAKSIKPRGGTCGSLFILSGVGRPHITETGRRMTQHVGITLGHKVPTPRDGDPRIGLALRTWACRQCIEQLSYIRKYIVRTRASKEAGVKIGGSSQTGDEATGHQISQSC